VHVRHERRVCKFWLEPLTLARNYGFAAHELAEIRDLIKIQSEKDHGVLG
jgi:hypothetical protein